MADGLYEYSEQGERTYLLVWTKSDGTTGRYNPPASRVRQMAQLMQDGHSFESARLTTHETKPKQAVA